MMRPFALLLAATLGLQPALADGLTPKAKRELAAKNGTVKIESFFAVVVEAQIRTDNHKTEFLNEYWMLFLRR